MPPVCAPVCVLRHKCASLLCVRKGVCACYAILLQLLGMVSCAMSQRGQVTKEARSQEVWQE